MRLLRARLRWCIQLDYSWRREQEILGISFAMLLEGVQRFERTLVLAPCRFAAGTLVPG